MGYHCLECGSPIERATRRCSECGARVNRMVRLVSMAPASPASVRDADGAWLIPFSLLAGVSLFAGVLYVGYRFFH
jgi:DNA-directed RNA polymerase subunit RPC12/RpoP